MDERRFTALEVDITSIKASTHNNKELLKSAIDQLQSLDKLLRGNGSVGVVSRVVRLEQSGKVLWAVLVVMGIIASILAAIKQW